MDCTRLTPIAQKKAVTSTSTRVEQDSSLFTITTCDSHLFEDITMYFTWGYTSQASLLNVFRRWDLTLFLTNQFWIYQQRLRKILLLPPFPPTLRRIFQTVQGHLENFQHRHHRWHLEKFSKFFQIFLFFQSSFLFTENQLHFLKSLRELFLETSYAWLHHSFHHHFSFDIRNSFQSQKQETKIQENQKQARTFWHYPGLK